MAFLLLNVGLSFERALDQLSPEYRNDPFVLFFAVSSFMFVLSVIATLSFGLKQFVNLSPKDKLRDPLVIWLGITLLAIILLLIWPPPKGKPRLSNGVRVVLADTMSCKASSG